jgi:3',5'-nucleoside bisphosphate phosphatase
MAKEKGLQAIAFADHNTVDNVEEGFYWARKFGLEFISALELNTIYQELDLHLLCFGVDPHLPALTDWLGEIHQKKKVQAKKRFEKLNELGFFFTWEDLQNFSQDRLPTGMSFLQAILEHPENRKDPRLRPYIDGDRSNSPFVNFYRDFLRGGKPAFVPIEDVASIQAIDKIKGMGGIPVLAHPSDTPMDVVLQLIQSGLEGLEVYSPYHNPEEQNIFRSTAEKYNLLITAGSDFHGKAVKPDVELGQVAENHYVLFQKLKASLKDKS